MKYYHVMLRIKAKGEFYRNDETDLDTIIEEVIKPYLEDREFFFSSTMVRRIFINEIKIIETNAKAQQIYEEYTYKRSGAPYFGLTIKDAPFFCDNRPQTKDITQDVIRMVQAKKSLPNNKQLNEQHTQPESNIQTKKKPRLFISYSHADSDYVEELVEQISKLGVEFFYDKKSIDWGDEWEEKIFEGIDDADYAIIIFSKDFGKRGWTKKEQDAFINKQKETKSKILPILHNIDIEEVDSGFIKKIQAIKSADYDFKDITILLSKIIMRSVFD